VSSEASAGDTDFPAVAGETLEHRTRVIDEWLVAQTLAGTSIEPLFSELCDQLAELVCVSSVFITTRAIHPLVAATALAWREDTGSESFQVLHGATGDVAWRQSPLRALVEEGSMMRRYRLEEAGNSTQFPILLAERERGATDYLALMTPFVDVSLACVAPDEAGLPECRDGMLSSWVTHKPDGFSDADIEGLRFLTRRLGVAVKLRQREQTASSVVSAYLGPHAGQRVLDGQIKLGDGEMLSAIILYTDLRDSTRLAEALPSAELLETLNAYFQCTAGAVLDHGGDVLRFIGDSVLAIFAIDGPGGEARAARIALAAAQDAERRLVDINRHRRARGKLELRFGLALHVGEVLFGNIGVPERIEFSIIGTAVNEVSRFEELTKETGHAIVVSDEFARQLPLSWKSLGHFHVRGVDMPE
jgi:adenylate cyclase